MRLKPRRVSVAAPRELVFEVVAAGGRDLGDAGAERIVEFESRWRGMVFKTTEAVRLDPPCRIAYRWVAGPLVEVHEEIRFEDRGAGGTVMIYSGTFQPPDGVTGWLRAALVVRPIFDRLVLQHLDEARRLAEARAARSRVYPRLSSH